MADLTPESRAFDLLARRAQACTACSTMQGRRRVLSRLNGNPAARLLFVAEAPGRLGGELTGVPLSRDQSGRRFEQLLPLAGLQREQVFITNAVLCNPRDAAGNNRAPSRAESLACTPWLRETIDLLRPTVLVTLGAQALAALQRIEPHGLRLRDAAALAAAWRGATLFPLYHPSPRAGLSRPYPRQEEDWRMLGRILRRSGFPVTG